MRYSSMTRSISATNCNSPIGNLRLPSRQNPSRSRTPAARNAFSSRTRTRNLARGQRLGRKPRRLTRSNENERGTRQMMKKIAGGFGSLVIALFLCGKASAYCHANAFGGGTAHTYGHTYHSNAYGGSTSHTYGEGTSHTNAYGGSNSHSYYGGTSHTNAYGGTTTGAYGAGAVHTTPYGTTSYASAYHPSTA